MLTAWRQRAAALVAALEALLLHFGNNVACKSGFSLSLWEQGGVAASAVAFLLSLLTLETVYYNLGCDAGAIYLITMDHIITDRQTAWAIKK